MASRVKIEIGGDTSDAKASIKDLEQSTKKSFEKMATEAEEAANDVSKAFKSSGIRTEKAIRQSSEKAKRDYEKIKNSGVASANDIKRAHNRMTEKIKKNNRELSTSSSKISSIFKNIKFAIIAATAAAAAFFGVKIFGEAIRFETALISLQKVMAETEGDAKQFTGQIEELAKTYGKSSAEILEGVAIFKQAGFEISESFLLQEAAMKLSIASELEVAEAAELVKRSLKGFKAPASEVIRLTDILNEISNNYGTNLKQLAIGMADLSPIAKKMGFSFEETVGLLTPIIEVFGSGSEAAQALKTGLLKLIDDAVPVTQALRKMGIEQHELNGAMRSGRDIYFEVAKRFETLEQNQKLVITSQLLGVRQAGKMVEVYDGLGLSTEVTNKALKSAGSINKEVAIGLASTATKGQRAAQSFNILAKSIGDILLPVWNKILDIAIPTLDAITSGIRGMSTAIKAIPNIGSFIINPFGVFNFLAPTKTIKNLTKETEALNAVNKESTKINKEITETHKKQAVALLDLEQIKKDQTDQIEKTRDIEIQAINATIDAQKTKNDLIKKAISVTRAELRALQTEVQRSVSFVQQILDTIAGSEKKRAQAGFDPLEKLLDDLNRAEDEFDQASKERAAGNIDRARKLTLSAVRAANAILEVQKDSAEKSEVTRNELNIATREAEKLVKAAKNFAIEMSTAAEEAIPAVKEQLSALEADLKAGRDTLVNLKNDIKLAKSLAVELKTILSQNTTATHTQFIDTVNRGSDVSPVPGFSAGVKLPGYGGGDKILAKLEAGERVIKKEAVRNLETLGSRAMTALHKGDIKGLIDSLPLPSFNQGGKVESSTPSGTTNVNLNLNGKTFPMTSKQSIADKFVQEIKSINVVRGRKKTIY